MQADPDGASAAARQPPILLEEIAAESRRRRELVKVVRRLSEQAGETPAIGAMRDAVNASLPGDWIVLAWEGEALVGALAYRPTDIGGGTLVSYVGSRKRGVGRRLVRVAARSAAERGEGLRAAAIPLASGFWERLGFRRVRKGGTLLPVFVLDARRTVAFAAGGEDDPAAQA